MKNLENWKEVTKGLYRYVIGANVAYEIHVLFWDHATDIKTAKSSLFLVGEWRTKAGKNTTERECLLSEQPLFECLAKAFEDNEENNQ
jgi:hypothetical protein